MYFLQLKKWDKLIENHIKTVGGNSFTIYNFQLSSAVGYTFGYADLSQILENYYKPLGYTFRRQYDFNDNIVMYINPEPVKAVEVTTTSVTKVEEKNSGCCVM